MALTLNDALKMNPVPYESFLKYMSPPHEIVSVDAPWSYAETQDGQRVGKDHDWRIENGQFIASGVWHESEPDEDARVELQALIDKWTAEGKDDAVSALDCCDDGIHWDKITKTVERPYSVDVPLDTVTFTRYWWDRPMTVS